MIPAVDDNFRARYKASRRVARQEERRPNELRASPKRFIGVCPRIEATRSGDRIFRFCSAGKKPGTRVLTRTRLGAHSRARFFERLCTAAFVAE